MYANMSHPASAAGVFEEMQEDEELEEVDEGEEEEEEEELKCCDVSFYRTRI